MISIEILWKSTAILLAAFGACALMRRAPASRRHFLWTATFVALLVMPLIGLVIPKWTPPVSITPASASSWDRPPGLSSASSKPSPRFDWLAALWLAGCLAAASRFLLASVRTARIVRRASESSHVLPDGLPPARILESEDAPMPMTWGIFRPVVVLPKDSGSWSPERLGAVLLHELTHVQRRDLLAQVVAQIACSLYWFHPLAWLALRRLRDERERACDDAVLLRGIAPDEYATHLLDLVRGVAARRNPLADAPAMAAVSGFESRIRALLDSSRKRQPLSYAAAGAIVALVSVVLIPIAAITAHAQAGRGAIAGVVKDPSGAMVPACTVVAKNLDDGTQETTTANATGEFRFPSIASGRYALEFRQPGFITIRKQDVTLGAGAVARVDANLEVGSISEAVTIRAQRPAGVAVAVNTAVEPLPIRVGGHVTQARLLRQPRPVYAEELRQAGLEGTVRIDAIISTFGKVVSPRVINAVDPRLAKAALDAVSQWEYEPTLLNGVPVETLTKIDMDFRLGQ